MKLNIVDASTDKQSILATIDDVNLYIATHRNENCIGRDHWLGNSRDGTVWAMFSTESTDEVENDTDIVVEKFLVAWLSDPPQRHPETIGAMLYSVHAALLSGNNVAEQELQAIVDCNQFPNYKLLSEHMPNPPPEWAELPVEIAIRLGLSEGTGINRSTYEKYSVTSLQEAVARVSCPRISGLLLIYEILAVGTVPFAPYEVDWPLSRLGTQRPYKREKVQGTLPWEYKTSACLFSVYQNVRRLYRSMTFAYFDQPTVRLVVAGRSPDNAIENWHRVAKHLRSVKRECGSCQI